MTRIAINGLGRIGRAVLKVLLDDGADVVAANDVIGSENRAYLLRFEAHAATADFASTLVSDRWLVLVRAWYDNEWGFVNQMARVVHSRSEAAA